MKPSFEYIQLLARRREGVDVEFKESTGQLDRGMETLCGMLNDDGFIVRVVFPRPKLDEALISPEITEEISDESNQYVLLRRPKENEVEQLGSQNRTVEQLQAKNRTVEQLEAKNRTVACGLSTVLRQYDPCSKSVARLILTLGNNILTAVELREALGLKSKGSFHTTYLKPALEDGAIVANNPNAPKDPNQRYRLTDKGLAYYYKHRNGSGE